jgi:hypothetical protein
MIGTWNPCALTNIGRTIKGFVLLTNVVFVAARPEIVVVLCPREYHQCG